MALQFPALRRFLILVEERHFGRAAARLNMSQPTLTRSIHALEEAVGARLFSRATKREVALTDAGEQLASDARVLLNDISRAEANTRLAAGQTPTSSLNVALDAGLVNGRAALSLARFGKAFPYLTMTVEISEPDTVTSRLRAGELDVGVVHAYQLDVGDDLVAMPLWTDRFLWAVGADHPLAQRDVVTELDEVSWPYALDAAVSNVSSLREFSRLRGLPDAPVSIRTKSWALLRATLLAGTHIGVLSEDSLRQDLAEGTIVPLPGHPFTRDMSVVAITRRHGVRRTVCDALIAELCAPPTSE